MRFWPSILLLLTTLAFVNAEDVQKKGNGVKKSQLESPFVSSSNLGEIPDFSPSGDCFGLRGLAKRSNAYGRVGFRPGKRAIYPLWSPNLTLKRTNQIRLVNRNINGSEESVTFGRAEFVPGVKFDEIRSKAGSYEKLTPEYGKIVGINGNGQMGLVFFSDCYYGREVLQFLCNMNWKFRPSEKIYVNNVFLQFNERMLPKSEPKTSVPRAVAPVVLTTTTVTPPTTTDKWYQRNIKLIEDLNKIKKLFQPKDMSKYMRVDMSQGTYNQHPRSKKDMDIEKFLNTHDLELVYQPVKKSLAIGRSNMRPGKRDNGWSLPVYGDMREQGPEINEDYNEPLDEFVQKIVDDLDLVRIERKDDLEELEEELEEAKESEQESDNESESEDMVSSEDLRTKRSMAIGRVGFRPGKRSEILSKLGLDYDGYGDNSRNIHKRSIAIGRAQFRPGKKRGYGQNIEFDAMIRRLLLPQFPRFQRTN